MEKQKATKTTAALPRLYLFEYTDKDGITRPSHLYSEIDHAIEEMGLRAKWDGIRMFWLTICIWDGGKYLVHSKECRDRYIAREFGDNFVIVKDDEDAAGDAGSNSACSFTKFQNSRTEVDDLSLFLDGMEGPGFTYMGGACCVNIWNLPDGKYGLIITNQQWVDDDLEKLEFILFNHFFKS